MSTQRRARTRTSSFGTNGREGHDSSAYYARKINGSSSKASNDGHVYSEKPLPPQLENRVLLDSCTSPGRENRLPPRSVHLMVTSPPYGVGKDYDLDLSIDEYRNTLRAAWKETRRLLVPGGRVCINVANLGRKPYIPLHAYIIQDMLRLGFLMRGEIIWDKGSSAGGSTAWGSWMSASNPTIRDEHEYILLFSKGDYQRPKVAGRVNSIGRDEFMSSTRSVWRVEDKTEADVVDEDNIPEELDVGELEVGATVWQMPAESAKRVRHPAPYPVELPKRCIELYTYQDEVVYDPFMGSGTTGVAAIMTNRRFVGYEINPEYQELATGRLQTAWSEKRNEPDAGGPAE